MVAGEIVNVIIGTSCVPCAVGFLLQRIDRRTGLIQESNPEVLNTNDSGMLVLNPLEPMYAAPFVEVGALGRIVAQNAEGALRFVGIVKSVDVR